MSRVHMAEAPAGGWLRIYDADGHLLTEGPNELGVELPEQAGFYTFEYTIPDDAP